jgi:hypothetical protein
VPLALGLRVVLVGGARVQDRVVGEPLDVAGRELHVEVEVGLRRDRLVEVEQLALVVAERGDVRVSHDRAEVVAVVEGAQPAVREAARRDRQIAQRARRVLVAMSSRNG